MSPATIAVAGGDPGKPVTLPDFPSAQELAGDLAWFAADMDGDKRDDLVRVAGISDLDLSPDGEWVVYSAGEPNYEVDQPQSDLWRARWLCDHFGEPENLGEAINTKGEDIEPWISPDESTLGLVYSYSNKPPEVFVAANRPGAAATQVTITG